MANNKANTHETTLEIEAMNLPVYKSGVITEDSNIEVDVEMGSMIPYIVDVVNLRLEALQQKVTFNLEDYFSSLVHYRIMQIRGRLPRHKHQNIAIPHFFFPVLASLGKFDDPLRGITIMPKSTNNPMTLEEVERASFEMRSKGIKHSLGLPRTTTVETDEIFRVSESNRELKAAGQEPSNVTLLHRTAIKIEFLEHIFGAPRTRYIAVDDSKIAWEGAILRLLTNQHVVD